MKLKGYRCDRCGKNYEKNHVKDFEKHTLVGVGLLDLKQHVRRFELCDDCLQEVVRYLSYPEANVYFPEDLRPDQYERED